MYMAAHTVDGMYRVRPASRTSCYALSDALYTQDLQGKVFSSMLMICGRVFDFLQVYATMLRWLYFEALLDN
jgi:hypothetical protein